MSVDRYAHITRQPLSREPEFFEALIQETERFYSWDGLPEWIPCTDSDYLRDLPTMAERRKWLRKAKAELMRRQIQERVDEIAQAFEDEDEMGLRLLTNAFPEDLKLRKSLTPAQRQMWIDKATLASVGRSDEIASKEPIVYFIAAGDGLVKIGHTTNLRSRLRSLRTATPYNLRVLLVMPGTRDDEQALHKRFDAFRAGREWFKRCDPIDDFIAQNGKDEEE